MKQQTDPGWNGYQVFLFITGIAAFLIIGGFVATKLGNQQKKNKQEISTPEQKK